MKSQNLKASIAVKNPPKDNVSWCGKVCSNKLSAVFLPNNLRADVLFVHARLLLTCCLHPRHQNLKYLPGTLTQFLPGSPSCSTTVSHTVTSCIRCLPCRSTYSTTSKAKYDPLMPAYDPKHSGIGVCVKMSIVCCKPRWPSDGNFRVKSQPVQKTLLDFGCRWEKWFYILDTLIVRTVASRVSV